MGQIIQYEFLKLFTSRRFIYMAVLLLLADIGILMYTQYDAGKKEIPYAAYKKLNEEIRHMNQKEKGEWIDKQYERIEALDIIHMAKLMSQNSNTEMQNYAEELKNENLELYNRYQEEYRQGADYPYTGEIDKEHMFLSEIKAEYDVTADYSNIIEEILQKAENLEQISIFKNSVNDFSARNLKDTANEYKRMKGTPINYQIGKGFHYATRVSAADVLILLLILTMASVILSEEKEKNLLILVRSTKGGRTRTISAKIVVLFLGIVLAVTVMYLIQFLYYGSQIGYGDLGASLQSVSIFAKSILQVSLFQYLLIFLLTKIAAWLLLALILLLTAAAAKDGRMVYLSAVAVFLVSFVLYTRIGANSKYQVFKYINLLNVLEVNEIYQSYLNLKIGRFMQDVFTLSLFCGMLSIGGLITGIIIIYNQTGSGNRFWSRLGIADVAAAAAERIQTLFHKRMRPWPLFAQELYKQWMTNRTALLLVLFGLFQFWNYHTETTAVSYREMIYKNYMEVLEGKLTDKKEKFIKEEQERFRSARERLEQIEEKVSTGELSRNEVIRLSEPYEDILQVEEIFARVQEQYHYIKEHPKAEFVYDSGYMKLLRIRKYSFLESDIVLILMSILCFSAVFPMEYSTGFIQILNTTPKGRRDTVRNKIGVCMITAVLLFLMSILPEIGLIGKTYGFSGLSASITSLRYFAMLPESLSILGYTAVMYLLRFLAWNGLILMILWLSRRIRHTIWTMLAALGLLFLPLLLALAGLKAAWYISIRPVMNITNILLGVVG